MGRINHKKKANLLLWVWFALTSIVANLCKKYIELQGVTSYTGFNVPLDYLLMVVSIVIFCFCPLLICIGYHAQKAGMKKTLFFSRVVLILYALWGVILVVEKIFTFFM